MAQFRRIRRADFPVESSHPRSKPEDAAQRNDVPVANLSDADVVINMPMQWYFDALASMVPTAERTDTGVEIPRIDMPTFSIDSQALSGVDAVVGNAVISTRWLDAVGNLAKAVEMTARFVGNVADRDNEGFDYLKDRFRPYACTWMPWPATPIR